METLPCVISIIEKEMTKNSAFVQKDTEMIHRKVKRGDEDQLFFDGRSQCQEHSVNSVDDGACHRAEEHDGATLDEGCNAACHSASWAARAERYFDMFGFQSEYREGTRNMVFTGLGGNAVAAVGRRKFPFALAFTAERGDIHHLSGTVESWELPGDGPFLFPIDAQAKLGLIKDMARSRIFIENKPGFGTDADKCGGFRFAE